MSLFRFPPGPSSGCTARATPGPPPGAQGCGSFSSGGSSSGAARAQGCGTPCTPITGSSGAARAQGCGTLSASCTEGIVITRGLEDDPRVIASACTEVVSWEGLASVCQLLASGSQTCAEARPQKGY
jgi:hypothetical protein